MFVPGQVNVALLDRQFNVHSIHLSETGENSLQRMRYRDISRHPARHQIEKLEMSHQACLDTPFAAKVLDLCEIGPLSVRIRPAPSGNPPAGLFRYDHLGDLAEDVFAASLLNRWLIHRGQDLESPS